MKCAYHAAYRTPLPADRPPALSKSALLKERLFEEGVIARSDIVEPEPIDLAAAALVHTQEYLRKLEESQLSAAEERRLGLRWSDALWQRARLAAGGTLLAARTALGEGLAANLAGGSHHAFPDHGEGFCILNDVAIATCVLRNEQAVRRVAIIDLDVHQGNGTAAIFAEAADVFTLSMHAERNYPLAKMRSSLDVALETGTGDAEYLAALERYLPQVLDHSPDLAFYLAGVDVAQGDRYGKLSLSDEGIRRRDARVIGAVRALGIPLTIVLSGGYAASRARTAELHAHVIREAVACERDGPRRRAR